ncbi:MAG: hypothetical protein WAX04_03315, partial [Oscillospiraceae bacterium]
MEKLTLASTNSTSYPVYIDIDSIQVEASSVATTYEPYAETVTYVPGPLRSLPNGVKDEVDVRTGKKIQRISGPISVSGTMYASIDNTSLTNIDIIVTTAFPSAQTGISAVVENSTIYLDKNGTQLPEVAATPDDSSSVGKYLWTTDKKIWIM